jgi:general secretion pathway protein D
MRLRTAIPILLVSLALMIGGLSFARAQQQPVVPQVPLDTQRRLQIQQNPALERQIQEAGLKQQKQPQEQPPEEPPREGGGRDVQTPPNIRPFQTGLESDDDDCERTRPNAPITFNLEDADLPDLIRLISQITCKRFILPGKTRSIKATVYAPTKVTPNEAYQAFLSILQLNGMTVVPSGRYLKVVESQNIENQVTPVNTGGSPTPADDRFVTRMHRVENISAEDAATLLTRFKSPEGQVSAYAPTNTLILTDMGSNIRRMLRIVESIDVPRTGEQIWIERIHYVDASELATLLTELFPVGQPTGGGAGPSNVQPRPSPPRSSPTMPGSADQGGGGPATVGSRAGSRITKIMPEARSNSLVIVATESAYLRILEVIREIDVPLEGEGGIHVHRVQNGDAEDIASTLSALIGGGGGGGGRAAVGAQGGGGGNASVTAAGGGPNFEGEIRVTAHKPTNSLVITSSLHDYASLRSVIERLDAPRRQVFIEAVIMEMSVDRTREFGFSFHGGIPDTPTEGANMLGGFQAANSIGFPSVDSLTALALGIRGDELTIPGLGASIPAFGVVLNALAGSEDVNVLSTPHIIAIDNEEAEITVGQNVPLQNSAVGSLGSLGSLLPGATGDQQAGLGALAGLSGFGGTAPRQDVGTTLRITPHINDANEVRLEIQEEISEPGAAPPQGNLGVISLNKRTAKTQVVVRDMQTVVIGGLMRDRVTQSETKIPILGDIPLLGFLFRSEVTTTQKTNLLLFLTPYIIRDQTDLRAIFERKMRERQEFIDRYFVFGDQDYDPPIDYTRTRGLVSEIINEIDGMLEEQRLLEEAALRPPPEHVPRPAIGAAPEGPSSGDVVITPDGTEIVPATPPDEAQPPPEGNIQIQIDPGVVDPNQ